MSQEPQLQLKPLCKRVSNPSKQVSLHREEGGRREEENEIREGGRKAGREAGREAGMEGGREWEGRGGRGKGKREERRDTGTFILGDLACHMFLFLSQATNMVAFPGLMQTSRCWWTRGVFPSSVFRSCASRCVCIVPIILLISAILSLAVGLF